jgi:hypothetical protein
MQIIIFAIVDPLNYENLALVAIKALCTQCTYVHMYVCAEGPLIATQEHKYM